MMKKIIALAIVTIMLVLTGCGGNSNTQVGPSKTPFVGGSTALSMEFLDGTPPDEIFDDGQYPFGINIKLENLGEDDVLANEGYIEITGINPKDFGLGSQADFKQDLPGDMIGVKKNSEGFVLVGSTLVSEFDELNFQGNLKGNWGSDAEKTGGPRIRANLCYNYETQATTAVCLKRDMLTNINTKEICELNGEKSVYNSGAPIQVTKVYETPIGSSKIQLQFEISHVGTPNDRFYKFDTVCDDRATNTNKDIVYFELETDINGNYAQCSGLRDSNANKNAGYVELFNGKPRIVICQFDTGTIDGVYETLLSAKLKYRYYQFIEKPILIKDVSTE
jgi:hypothetical protein